MKPKKRRIYKTDVHTELGPPGYYYGDWYTEIEPYVRRAGYQHSPNTMNKAFREMMTQNVIDKSLGHCWYCGGHIEQGVQLSDQTDHTKVGELDHKRPKAQGGSNHHHNLVLACRRCNNTAEPGKGNRTVDDYRCYLLKSFYPTHKRLYFWGTICQKTRQFIDGKISAETFHDFLQQLLRPVSSLHVIQPSKVADFLLASKATLLSRLAHESENTISAEQLLQAIHALSQKPPTNSERFLAASPGSPDPDDDLDL